jgi:hypothetical protein
VHCSGAELDTRPLQFNWQFTDEPNEMSSAVCLSTNEPTSYTILQDMRGYDPGAAVTSLSTNEPRRPLNNEHITPENLAQPHYSTYDAESVSQCIDVTGRTIADCAQHIFSMSATERIEGEGSPQIAMKRCLCPGTPDPPTHLASATMHKKGRLHGTQAAFSPDWTPQHKGLQLVCCIAATYGMGPVYGWGASSREVSGKFSNFMHLKQCDSFTLVRIDGARIKSGAPRAGAGEGEQMWCIAATNATLALCEWDTSSREVSSKFSKVTDCTKSARIAVARLNWVAPFAGADIIKRVGGITATNATVALGEWDASLREMSSQLPNLAELRKFVRIDGARTKSGAPMAGAGEGEQTWCIAATIATLALCEWDVSSRKLSGKLSKFTDLTKFARIAVARLNWGAPLVRADNIKRRGGITAANATVALCEWDASLREMSSKLSNLEELRTFVRIDGARIKSGTPLAGVGEGEQMWCISATNATLALCEWDASSRKMSSRFSKRTDCTKSARIDVARLNWGAPFAGADIIERVGCITATNATVALGEWDASLREMSSQLPNLAKLRKVDHINGARIKSGAPIAGESDGEQTWCIAATNATVALCEWDTSSRKVSSKIPRAMSLKKVDLVDERGQRYQTKGKFGGSGRSSRSHSPGKDNHETARGSQ